MRSILKHLADYRREAILAPLFKLLEACFDLFVPLVVAFMIDEGISKGRSSIVFYSFLALVGLAVVGFTFVVVAQYYAAKAATGFASNLRRALFGKTQRLSFAELDRLGADSLATRLTSDVNQAQTGVNMLLRLFMRSPMIVFGATIMALIVDVQAALVFFAALPILAIIVFAIVLASLPLYTRRQHSLDAVACAARENLIGARVVRAFNMESEEIRRFDALTKAMRIIEEKAGTLAGLMNPATYLVLNLAIVVLISVGAIRVNIGTSTQGETVALINYMSQILIELIKLANLITLANKAYACSKRVAEVLETPDGLVDGEVEFIAGKAGDCAVAFRGVTLTYPGASGSALEDVSFEVQVGQTVGIIGGTGSGKTSLVNLIPRFYEAQGDVLIMGRPVADYRLDSLRDGIGIVPQKSELFSGTIGENLRWGKDDASDEELNRALEIAQASEFVNAKPDRLNFMIEQGGRNLSGGQRQRLTVARALVKKPAILILDDSASALDYATDAKLRAALAESRDNTTTTFIVSQRAASVRDADLILVLENGTLVGSGTHEELLDNNHVYQEIYYSQYPDENNVVTLSGVEIAEQATQGGLH